MKNSPVVSYVTEEVWRQGHDITAKDGLERVSWMLEAWCEAIRLAKIGKPTIFVARTLGCLVEPIKNEGFRKVDVRVGAQFCPPPERIYGLLQTLFEQHDIITPMEFYKGFEEIHPFVDGNGRTGKILLNWLNNTLHDPIFPPIDLWGHPIRNP